MAETTGSAIAQTNVRPPSALSPAASSLPKAAERLPPLFRPALTRAGRFTADANGTLTNIGLDQDFSGGVTRSPRAAASPTSPFTIDAAGTGRGTLNFTDVTKNQPFVFIFYMASPAQGFIQDNSANVVADGSITAQSGTFTAASMAGQYAINWSGENLANGFEEDFVGVIPVSSAGTNNITNGTARLTPSWATAKYSPIFRVNGLLTLQGDGTLGGAQGNALAVDHRHKFALNHL